MTLPETKERLSEVLELFLSPDYNVVSPTYLDLLLTHITANTNRNCAGAASDYEYCDVFQEWVVKAISVWEANSKPMQPITIFTLKLVGLIGKDELRFHYWHCQNVLNKLCTILELWQEDQAASVKMAYTTMLSDLVNHRSGRQWIIESGVWKGIIKFAHHNHTMYVTRESQKFLWSLLLAEQENREFCRQVILVIAAPLMSNSFDARLHPVLEDSYVEQNQLLCATLDSITGILENTLFQTMENRIADMMEETIDLEMRVKALFEACISTKFLQHVHKLLILILFSKLKHGIKGENEVIDLEVWQKCRYRLYYICMMLLSKKYVIELVKTNKLTILYWKKLQGIRKFELPEKHRFEHQAICLMVLPLCVCVKKKYMKHDMFDMFINKLFDVTCTTIQRLAYNVRDVIWKGDLPLEQMCKVSIDLLLEIIDIMDRDVAVITFQTLCHVLKNYMPDIHDGPCNGNPPVALSNPSGVDRQRRQPPGFKSILEGNPVVDSPVLLAALLNGIAVMTEKFKFKWQECVETICVLSLAQEILKHPGILPMICVKALKVCKLAIYNFMPPNLVLLVDTDSHMNDIGPTLYKRLHDPNWEVRDSVLEVLNTIAAISEDKYPAFQDFLLANEFLPLAVHVATSDSESYVRASALTFISSTVRINKLWDEKLSQLNLPSAAILLLSGESEAIVRREAVILIKELYVYRKWPKSTIERMSRALAAAAALDLHWEVKTQALEFWKHFIKAHLADQGVLDGFFPKVTFSKEHRKIMALNETEIKRRLNKALDELARQFCLGVLLVTLDDDSDFAVCKASAAIIKKLKSFLLKYKMNEPLPVLPPARDSSTIDTTYQKQLADSRANIAANPKNADSSNVIEAIVDETDTNLLASIYKNSMKMDSESGDTEDKALQYISSVTRETFLQAILDRDIDAYIEEKGRWLASYTNSFESVLDDILTMYKQGDVNSMDCY